MKTLYALSAIALSTVLMGCQIEITPLDTTLTTNATATTDTTADTSSTGGTDAGSTDTGSTDTGTDVTASNGVTLYWTAPLDRVNGSTMTFTEIGGYEIRYKQATDTAYTTVVINDASVEQYNFDSIDNAEAYTFEVAVFDQDGLYSEFAVATASN